MYNIIIFGTGSTSELVKKGLNDSVNIVCYCDNNSSKWDKIYDNVLVQAPNNLKKIQYDFIVIASEYNDEIYNQLIQLQINPKKILQFFTYYGECFNYVKSKIEYLLLGEKKVREVLATGISYMERAIDGKFLCKKIVNMASPSQDIYYDYNLFKYIVKNNLIEIKQLKYVFIGLSYYSFHYDMSKSSMKKKVLLYYEAIGENHNLANVEYLLQEKKTNTYIGDKIFKRDYYNKSLSINHINDISEEKGKIQAAIDSRKNYPHTFQENIEILREYINFAKKNNVKPIIIVAPASKYYANNFSIAMKSQFLDTIENLKRELNFQYIDYFNSKLFEDKDFYDVSHLNDKGAEKFTKILNEQIKW